MPTNLVLVSHPKKSKFALLCTPEALKALDSGARLDDLAANGQLIALRNDVADEGLMRICHPVTTMIVPLTTRVLDTLRNNGVEIIQQDVDNDFTDVTQVAFSDILNRLEGLLATSNPANEDTWRLVSRLGNPMNLVVMLHDRMSVNAIVEDILAQTVIKHHVAAHTFDFAAIGTSTPVPVYAAEAVATLAGREELPKGTFMADGNGAARI